MWCPRPAERGYPCAPAGKLLCTEQRRRESVPAPAASCPPAPCTPRAAHPPRLTSRGTHLKLSAWARAWSRLAMGPRIVKLPPPRSTIAICGTHSSAATRSTAPPANLQHIINASV
ncbi:hypothetical protein E2C01_024349 [Portunus trituberculatus]|uniref:Uncharacterized protein n=1 Tax=Portunus trituberculatus TaxID=210409 RepID=A0A5B7EDL0_PORTR|nr:hypothetical protein [Portunus trituberculatus]